MLQRSRLKLADRGRRGVVGRLRAACGGLLAAGAAVIVLAAAGRAGAQAPIRVDVELVLAVDVSGSMTREELEIQRRGYAAAFVDAEVLAVIERGYLGRVALAYMEWAGASQQKVVVGWTLVRNREEAAAFAERLTTRRHPRLRLTAIASAIDFAAAMFDGNGFEAARQVIDISGDAASNDGRLVTLARDEAVAKGVTINGLPLMTQAPATGRLHVRALDVYYRDCVIGGDGAFAIPVKAWSDFPAAVRQKLLLELAGVGPRPFARPGAPKLWPAAIGAFGDPCGQDKRQWRPSWWIPDAKTQ